MVREHLVNFYSVVAFFEICLSIVTNLKVLNYMPLFLSLELVVLDVLNVAGELGCSLGGCGFLHFAPFEIPAEICEN